MGELILQFLMGFGKGIVQINGQNDKVIIKHVKSHVENEAKPCN